MKIQTPAQIIKSIQDRRDATAAQAYENLSRASQNKIGPYKPLNTSWAKS